MRTISKSLGLDFKRIQFTPDLMPSDIVGTEVLDENKDFKFIKGPLFGNLILLMKLIEHLQKLKQHF